MCLEASRLAVADVTSSSSGLLLLALCLLALYCRQRQRSWAAPAACSSGYWAVATGAPMLLARDYVVSTGAVAIVFAAACCYCVGVLVATSQHGPAPVRTPMDDEAPRWAWALVLCGTAAGLIAALVVVQANDYP